MKEKLNQILIQIKKPFTGSALKKSTPNVLRDWFILLGGAFFVAIVLASVGTYTFLFIKGHVGENEIVLEPLDDAVSFEKNQLEQLVILYRERAEQFSELKASVMVSLKTEESTEENAEEVMEGGEEEVAETEIDENDLSAGVLTP